MLWLLSRTKVIILELHYAKMREYRNSYNPFLLIYSPRPRTMRCGLSSAYLQMSLTRHLLPSRGGNETALLGVKKVSRAVLGFQNSKMPMYYTVLEQYFVLLDQPYVVRTGGKVQYAYCSTDMQGYEVVQTGFTFHVVSRFTERKKIKKKLKKWSFIFILSLPSRSMVVFRLSLGIRSPPLRP